MEQKRRRFYTITQNFRWNPSDFEFVNEADALVNTIFPGAYVTKGSHEYSFLGKSDPKFYGLPILREQPVLKVGLKRKSIDVYGFGHIFYVSSRVKLLLVGLDKDAFEFRQCRTLDRRGQPVEPYWMMAVIRAVEDFDRPKSNFVTYKQRNPNAPDFQENDCVVQFNDIYMPSGFNDNYRAFYLSSSDTNLFVDGMIVDMWRTNKFNSWVFTPLQPPTKMDFKDQYNFKNSPFWTEKDVV